VFLDQNPDFPIYRLKAPALVPNTSSNIYVFDKWTGNNVAFGGGATTTINRETDVVFKKAGVTITAEYVSANANSKPAIVEVGKTLDLPAGSIYRIDGFYENPGFKFHVYGSLLIEGDEDNKVTIGNEFPDPEEVNCWQGIKIYPGGSLYKYKCIYIYK